MRWRKVKEKEDELKKRRKNLKKDKLKKKMDQRRGRYIKEEEKD